MPTQADSEKARANQRNSIILETSTILNQHAFAGQQYLLKLHAPRIAALARPGQFVHLRCDDEIPMRRPYSIMSTTPEGTIEILYKVVGEGSKKLATKKHNDRISCLGPIGNGFVIDPQRPALLLIGGGVGIPPILFLAEHARSSACQPTVLMGSEVGFPFATTVSSLPLAGCLSDTNLSAQALEELSIPSRLASDQGIDGCHKGYLDSLARLWIEATDTPHSKIEIFACGPQVMLQSIAKIAFEFDLACQLAVEEYMACGIGGCAGCTIPVQFQGRTAMKRVCVDGPVFKAQEIFFDE